MVKEFKEVVFETLYAEPSRNGLTKPRSVRGKGYKMINMGELFAYGRICNPPMDLVPLNENEIKNTQMQEGDLLFARQSLIASGAGKCSIVLKCPEITTFESHLIRVRLNKKISNPLFYYYYFSSPIGTEKTQSLVSQVAAAGIRGSELAKLNVHYIDLEYQDKIAKVLSNYDDLIENNNKRIKILEEMAQKIYKEWFVDFKFPNHETATFKQTELGKIPSDWEVVTVDTFCNIFTGKKNANAAISNGKYKFYTCAPEPLLIDTYIYDGRAVIIAGNGSYTGRTLFYDGKFDLYQRTYACTIKENYTDDYIYTLYAIIKNSLEKDISGGTHGAAVPYIVFDDIAKHQFAFNKRVFDKSSIIFKQIFNAILMFNKKNQTLKQTRDLLLPRLISGEIDVENMEIV